MKFARSLMKLRPILVPVFFLILAGLFLSSALILVRVNQLIAKSDAEWAEFNNPTFWEKLDQFPVSWVVVSSGQGESAKLREALIEWRNLYSGKKLEEAKAALIEPAQSKDGKIASLVLNLLGQIFATEGFAKKDIEKFETALDLFEAALNRNPDNDDAKFNLELILASATYKSLKAQSQNGEPSDEKGDEIIPGLPRPESPALPEDGAGQGETPKGY